MPGASTSGAPGETARQGGPSRLRNALLFVVIAWSIAGAFQLLFWAGPWLVDRGVKAGWMPDGIVKPRPVQTVDCTAAVQGMPQREAGRRDAEARTGRCLRAGLQPGARHRSQECGRWRRRGRGQHSGGAGSTRARAGVAQARRTAIAPARRRAARVRGVHDRGPGVHRRATGAGLLPRARCALSFRRVRGPQPGLPGRDAAARPPVRLRSPALRAGGGPSGRRVAPAARSLFEKAGPGGVGGGRHYRQEASSRISRPKPLRATRCGASSRKPHEQKGGRTPFAMALVKPRRI